MTRIPRLLAILCVLLSLVPTGASVRAEEPTAPTVRSAEPLLPPRALPLAEEWRLGGEDGDVMFGLMVEALRDVEGRTYLMDQQLCQATVVGPDGTVLRTIGRQGEGPGEVRAPQGIVLMPDGAVALAEMFPGKLVKLTPEGEPAGTVRLGNPDPTSGGFTAVSSIRGRGDVLLLGALFQAPLDHGQSRRSYLATIAPDGSELVRFRRHRVDLDFQKAHFVEREMLPAFLGAHALGPDGRVYSVVDRNSYIIQVHAPDGRLERTISREFIPVQRTKKEKRRIDALFEVQARNLPFPLTWEVEENEQSVNGMRVATDGTLWVEHARSSLDQPEGVFSTYDVFDPDGRWRQEVSVACEGDPAYDGILFLDDEHLLLVKGLDLARLTASGSQGAVFDEDDQESAAAMEVICYRVTD